MVAVDETEDRGDPVGENIVIGSNWSRHITVEERTNEWIRRNDGLAGVRRTVIIIIRK